MTTSTHDFGIDPNLLNHVINSQTGELWRAVCEGCHNSLDAHASKIEIVISPKRITIIDNGNGLLDDAHVSRMFGTFGTPHYPGDSKMGKFRIGRGQMFSYGLNIWRSGIYELRVDIRNKGLRYDVSKSPSRVDGCRIDIELYQQLTPSRLYDLERQLTTALRYYYIPVSINGILVSTHPEECKWDLETPDCYARFKENNSLTLYHFGVMIGSLGSYRLGTGGVLVSKRILNVNFARNEVNDSCENWRTIRKQVQTAVNKRHSTSRKLDSAARENLILQFSKRELSFSDIEKLKILEDVSGNLLSFHQLPRKGRGVISFAERGHRIGDKIMQRDEAVVLSTPVLEMFCCVNPEELRALILNSPNPDRSNAYQYWKTVSIRSIDELSNDFSEKHDVLNDSSLTSIEKLWIRALNKTFSHIDYSRFKGQVGMVVPYWLGEPKLAREFRIGLSDTAEAWTDGYSTIVLNRYFLNEFPIKERSLRAVIRVCGSVLHEFCHDDSDMESHIHDDLFYRTFHDQSDQLMLWANDLLANLNKVAQTNAVSRRRAIAKLTNRVESLRSNLNSLDMEEKMINDLKRKEKELLDKFKDNRKAMKQDSIQK